MSVYIINIVLLYNIIIIIYINIYRIKSMFGRPYWEKDIIKELGLYDIKVRISLCNDLQELLIKMLCNILLLILYNI